MTREEKIADLQRQIDELKELPNGVWYKSIFGCSIAKKTGTEDGFGYTGNGLWYESVWYWENEKWQPATSQEIEEAVKKRWNEINPVGLEFDCLTLPTEKTATGYRYNLEIDEMYLDGQCFYKKGKFATLIKKKTIRMKDLKYGQVAMLDGRRITRMYDGFICIDDFENVWIGHEECEVGVELITEPITITFNQ